MRIANYQGVFDFIALVSIRVNIKHAHKHDIFSIKRQEQDSTVKMDAVLFLFLFFDDFF